MNKLVLGLAGPIAIIILAGCTGTPFEPSVKIQNIEPDKLMSTTASLSHVFIRDENSSYITCTQPSPDAAFDQSETASLSISLISLGGDDAGSEEENSAEVEMAGRTPTVLMTRELFYRACEFSMNYQLNKKEALDLYLKTLDAVSEVWATEAGNTTVTIGDSLVTTTTSTISDTSSGSISEEETPGTETDDDS